MLHMCLKKNPAMLYQDEEQSEKQFYSKFFFCNHFFYCPQMMPSYKKSVLKQRKSIEVTCATFTSEFAANKLLQFIT